MKERNFTKEELIELLLHPSPRERRERHWRKMFKSMSGCYASGPQPTKPIKCQRCGTNMLCHEGEYDYFYKLSDQIAGLGYDTKLETYCNECAQKLAGELGINENDFTDDNFEFKYTFSPWVRSNRNYLFSFKPKDSDQCHQCLTNDFYPIYKLLEFLCDQASHGKDAADVICSIDNEKFYLKHIAERNFIYAPHLRIPGSVVLELTYRCNHHCIFCSCPWFAPGSTYPKGEELNLEQWKKVIDKLYDLGVYQFTLSGGEATLKDCMPQIVEYIREEGERRGSKKPIVLISNGLAMTEEYLQLFKRYNVQLSMSLPGYRTFEEHTGVDNADGVLSWFTRAKELGIRTTVNVTVTQKNLHELFETISLGLISGAGSLLLNRFLPGGRGLAHKDELLLSKQQVNDMFDVAEEVLSIVEKDGDIGTEVAACAIRGKDKYKELKVGYKCSAAKWFFVIDPSGNIRVCNHSPHVVGHIFHNPIIDDMDYWNTFAKEQYKPEACKGCKLIEECDCGCREVAHILHGSPKAEDSTIMNKNR